MQIGISGVLTVLFVILKVTGYIHWSWWLVFSPLWIGALIVFGLLLLAVILKCIAECL